jgi:hypothetical protein
MESVLFQLCHGVTNSEQQFRFSRRAVSEREVHARNMPRHGRRLSTGRPAAMFERYNIVSQADVTGASRKIEDGEAVRLNLQNQVQLEVPPAQTEFSALL